jgi:hypothetical protein
MESIEIGMSRSEIETRLGAPPGVYISPSKIWYPIPLGGKFIGYEAWVSDEGELHVLFDDDEKSVSADVMDVALVERSWLQRVRVYLRW